MEEIITRLIILGAGGYGRTIADLAAQTKQYDEIKFLDDNAKGYDVIGTIKEAVSFINEDTAFYPAIGNNEFRCKMISELVATGGSVVSIIHQSAYVSPTVKLGVGVAILPNASVGTNVQIGNACIINMHAVVDHDTILSEGVHVAPGAIIKGENIIGAYCKIESGQVVERGEMK